MRSIEKIAGLALCLVLMACVSSQPPPIAAAFSTHSTVSFSCSGPSIEKSLLSQSLKLKVAFENKGGVISSGCAKAQAIDSHTSVIGEKSACSKILYPGEIQVIEVVIGVPAGADIATYACVRS